MSPEAWLRLLGRDWEFGEGGLSPSLELDASEEKLPRRACRG